MTVYESSFAVLETTSKSEDIRRRLTKKLRRMNSFTAGWSHGEGLPVSIGAIRIAEFFVLVACDLGFACDVFPNLDGGCAVALYEGDERLEVSISPEACLDVRIEKGIGLEFNDILPRRHDVSIDWAIAQIIHFRPNTWSSGFLTYVNSTATANVSGTLSTVIQPNRQTQKPLLMDAAGFQSSWLLARARI